MNRTSKTPATVALSMALMGGVVAAVGGGSASAVTGAPGISVVQTTTETYPTFSGAGVSVPLAFLVTNSGNETLTSISVTDPSTSGGSATVGICTPSILLPGEQSTCAGTYITTTTDVTDGTVSLTASATSTNSLGSVISSAAPSTVTVSYAGTSPLTPTQVTGNDMGDGWVINPPSNPYSQADWQNWTIYGRTSTGVQICTTTSTPPTGPEAGANGVTCLGKGLNGALAIGVPSPDILLGGIVRDSTDYYSYNILSSPNPAYPQSSWTPVSTPWSVPPGGIAVGCPAGFIGSSVWGDAACNQFVALTSYDQYIEVSTYQNGIPFDPSVPLDIQVEPTGVAQADAVVNRIVYQPPGQQSTQTYSSTQTTTTQTDVSFGQTNAETSAFNKSLSNEVKVGASTPWFSFDYSYTRTWKQSETTVNTQEDTSGNGQIISYTVGSGLGVANGSSHATEPAWWGDEFDLLVNPQFVIWNVAECEDFAIPVAVPPDKTACPSGHPLEQGTGTIVDLSGAETDTTVTAAELIPCATTTGGTYQLSSDDVIDQNQCQAILAQDPFAGTALGLIPTPPGETAGQAVDPSLVLTGQAQTPFLNAPYSSAASKNTKTYDWQTWNQTFVSYSSTSTAQTSLNFYVGSSASVTASAGVEFLGFGSKVSDTLTAGSSNSNGTSLTTTYTGSSTTTQAQNAQTEVVLQDTQNALSVTPYADQRFSTIMFSTGDEGTGAVPSVSSTGSSVGGLSLTLEEPLNHKEKLKGNGAMIVVATPHESLGVGQKLVLPGGQTLTTSAASPDNDSTVLVRKAKIKQAVALPSSITVPGYVTVAGSGFYGPLQVEFCLNITSIPQCTATNYVYVNIGQGVLYAPVPNEPRGSQVSVFVESQAGNSSNWWTYTA